MVVDKKFQDWKQWFVNSQFKKEVFDAKLSWASLLYIIAGGGAAFALVTPAAYAFPASVRYPLLVGVLVVSLMMLSIEIANTFFKRR
jgi:multidrug transporter EmrE-like cation transporter